MTLRTVLLVLLGTALLDGRAAWSRRMPGFERTKPVPSRTA